MKIDFIVRRPFDVKLLGIGFNYKIYDISPRRILCRPSLRDPDKFEYLKLIPSRPNRLNRVYRKLSVPDFIFRHIIKALAIISSDYFLAITSTVTRKR